MVFACGSTQGSAPVEGPRSEAVANARSAELVAIEAARDLDGVLVGPHRGAHTVAITFATWCGHCRSELAVIDSVRASYPEVRWLGLNYQPHEEYANRGSRAAVRAFVAEAPWLRVVPMDEALFATLGSPPKVPTVYVFDGAGALLARFDRRERELPGADELAALLRR